MKLLVGALLPVLAFLGCAHPGHVENSADPGERGVLVHIKDKGVVVGDSLVVKRYTCKEKRVSEKKMGLVSCTSKPVGCAKVLRAGAEAERFFVELGADIKADEDLVFERPGKADSCR